MRKLIYIFTVIYLPVLVFAQSPNKYGWIYNSFPTGYGWVMPRPSPTAIVSQTIGVTDVSVRYARPSVNERVVYGDLVPYEKVWRAGANESTVISFSTDVYINGEPLAAGEYSLFMIPGEKEWTVIFSNKPHQWGAFIYKQETDDVLRVPATPRSAEFQETLQYTFPLLTDSSAELVLHWDKIQIPITISVDLDKLVVDAAYKTFDWRAGYFAADYFLKNSENLEESLKWINASIALTENSGNLFLKAEIIAKIGNVDEAVRIAKKSLEFVSPERKQFFEDHVNKFIGGLKSSIK